MWPAFTETWCQLDPTPFWGWIWKLTLMLDLTEQIPAVGFKNVVARLNPEPEVIVIIFTIIMWVECLGVHTLLYIYGSSVSLSVPYSLSARLSLSPPRPPASLPSSPHRGPGSQPLSTEKNGLFLHSCQTSAAAWRNKARSGLFQRDGANRPKVFVTVGLKRPPDKLDRAHTCLKSSQMLRYHFVN